MVIAPTKPRWALAKSKADELTANFSFPPIPALEIAESRGVDVVFVAFSEFEDDVSGFCDFNSAKLYVNQQDQPSRQNFTIAHELGHWVLHRSLFVEAPQRYQFLPRFTQPDRDDPLEKEANHFAANLLVPQKLLRPVLHAPVSKLADIFSVSKIMMEWRVRNG